MEKYLWFAVLLVFVWLMVLWLDPDLRRSRRYEKELAAHEPTPDSDFMVRHFTPGEVALDVPVFVRRAFAKHTGLPAEMLLPDDDLALIRAEMDASELIAELESAFGVTFSPSEVEQTPCTIRAVSFLVTRMAARNPPSP